jgi:hypothetical protein
MRRPLVGTLSRSLNTRSTSGSDAVEELGYREHASCRGGQPPENKAVEELGATA